MPSLCPLWQSGLPSIRRDPKNPQHPALDNDFTAPNMDSVKLSANIETRSQRPAAVRGTPTAGSRPGEFPLASIRPMDSGAHFQPIDLPHLLDTPCRVIFALTQTKQRNGALAKCNKNRASIDTQVARNTPAHRRPCAKIDLFPLQERLSLA